jgi:uridine kinase
MCADETDHHELPFAFRPLTTDDLPRLLAWLAEPHVARWWPTPDDPVAEFIADDGTRRFVAELDGRPIAMIQFYPWSNEPPEAEQIGAQPGEFGIDYLIGEPDLIGRGIGPAMLNAFLAENTSGRGDVTGVRVDIHEDNRRSWRTLEKLGFVRARSGHRWPDIDGPHYVYVRATDSSGAAVRDGDVARVVEAARRSTAPGPMRCKIVAIDGLGGAGKSTLAFRVARELGSPPVIHTDDFASWDNPVDWYERMLEQVLLPLANRRPARYQRFDWDRNALAEWHTIDADDFLIIEGVTASRIAFRPYLAVTVWVQTSRAERLRRAIARDTPGAADSWEAWMRDEDAYVAREHPSDHADLVVSGERAGPDQSG